MDSGLYVQANHELHHEDSQEARQAESSIPDQGQQPSNLSASDVRRGIYNLQLHGSRISLLSCHHFPLEDLIQTFIEENSAEQPLDSVVVKSAVYGKKLKIPHHEFVVFELGHTRDPSLRNHVILDRTRVTGANVLSSVQQSNSAIARDEFRFSCDGNRDKLLERCGLIPYDTIETIEFSIGNLLPFYVLATIALVTSHQRDYYHLLDANCYWFAGLIWEQVLEMYPDARRKILRHGVRGKLAGLLNSFTSDELERDEIELKIQSMLSEMKTIIIGVQKVCESSDPAGWDYVPRSSWIKGHSQIVSSDDPAEDMLKNQQDKRTRSLLELLYSEHAYACDLALIRDTFLPLAQGKQTRFPLPLNVDSMFPICEDPPMSAQDVKIVFGNIEEIAAFSEELSERLETALGSVVPAGTGYDRVGELFCELAPRMTPMYLAYITQHPAAVARYTQLSTNPTQIMAQYLAATKSITTSIGDAQDIPSLLMKPIKRVLQYPLILQTILEPTPTYLNHPDRERLIMAGEETKRIVHQVNKSTDKRRWQFFRAVFELDKSPQSSKPRTPKLSGLTNGSKADQNLPALEKRVEERAGNQSGIVIAEKPCLNSQIGRLMNSNPVWSTCSTTLGKLIGCTFPGVLSPLKSTMITFLEWVDSMEDIDDSDKEFRILASELSKTVEFLAPQLDNPHCSALSEYIGNTIESITGNFRKIEAERKLIRGRGLIEARLRRNKIHACVTAITGELERLRLQIQVEILTLTAKAEEDKLIDSLSPSQSALYGSNPEWISRQYCAKDTRVEILEMLDSWSNDSGSYPMWLTGMAGTGKTTIACSFAKTLHVNRKLIASFFCSRVDPECRDVSRIIPTIAYQLANLSPEFRRQLGNLLKGDPSLSGLKDIPGQFTNLLKAPLNGVARGSKDIIVLIDALDECDEPGQVGMFLDHLAKCIEELPLKFLISSRPEAWILRRMQPVQGPALAKSIIPLHEIDESSVRTDIKLYLKQELEFMQLHEEQLELLAGQSGTLFIYAATLVRYINPMGQSIPSYQRLSNVLRLGVQSSRLTRKARKAPKLYKEMDRLYALVVNNALGRDLENDEITKVQMVLKTILCAKEPISIKTIAVLCGLDDGQDTDDLSFTLERLRSVIYVSKTSSLISVFHTSFPDFMFDKDRSHNLFCDPDKHNHLMAKQCFGLMEGLRFNICDLGSSYMTDEEAITLSQVEDAIEPALSYACQHWAEHLARTTCNDLCEELKDFLSQRLLFWMEVLTLKGSIAIGGDKLLLAVSWLLSVGGDDDLITLAEDARNFVTSFAANPISISTPHIYTSLLPLCPRSSTIFKCYRDRFQNLIEPDHRATQYREVAALASWKHESVLSVAYSHDGTEIAFGCMDGNVGVRASHGGASMFNSPGDKAHQKPVWSVAFAPTNEIGIHTYLASGSDDGTIRIWTTHTSDDSVLTLRS
ncbi:unnamed protein product, partial [Rhizoctonia solani]